MLKLLILIHDSWLSYYSCSKKQSHSKPSDYSLTDYPFKANIENCLRHNFLIPRVSSCNFVVILHTQKINNNSILNFYFHEQMPGFVRNSLQHVNISFFRLFAFYKIVGRKKLIQSVNLFEVYIGIIQMMDILNINQIANAKLLSSNNFTYQKIQELTFHTIMWKCHRNLNIFQKLTLKASVSAITGRMVVSTECCATPPIMLKP